VKEVPRMTKRTNKQRFDIVAFARSNGIDVRRLADGTWVAMARGRAVYSPNVSDALVTLLRRYRKSLVLGDTVLSPRAAIDMVRSTSSVVVPDSPTPPHQAESGDEPLAEVDAPPPALAKEPEG
jgi:hypothetical protein